MESLRASVKDIPTISGKSARPKMVLEARAMPLVVSTSVGKPRVRDHVSLREYTTLKVVIVADIHGLQSVASDRGNALALLLVFT
jgi:hypothetical protein